MIEEIAAHPTAAHFAAQSPERNLAGKVQISKGFLAFQRNMTHMPAHRLAIP
ncbi:hypothetical protein [Zavarzinia sp.]|uniref:hypothetical protein n=1 Tax=Zavarzinia sp. TaxID=2027920 RepID=UPI003BB4BFE7